MAKVRETRRKKRGRKNQAEPEPPVEHAVAMQAEGMVEDQAAAVENAPTEVDAAGGKVNDERQEASAARKPARKRRGKVAAADEKAPAATAGVCRW